MLRFKLISILPAIILIASSLMSCSDDNTTPDPIVSTSFSNLDADAGTGRGSMGEILGATGKFTFFSFKTGAVVDHADSASAKWDIGFRGTTIIVNNGSSGPGEGGAIVSAGIFDEMKTAPDAGYDIDSLVTVSGGTKKTYAIPTGSGNGWYTYDAGAFVIKPTPGKFLVIKTADGHYAKMEILSYYKDAPSTPDFMTDIDRYYTFRFVYQPNDTKTFE